MKLQLDRMGGHMGATIKVRTSQTKIWSRLNQAFGALLQDYRWGQRDDMLLSQSLYRHWLVR